MSTRADGLFFNHSALPRNMPRASALRSYRSKSKNASLNGLEAGVIGGFPSCNAFKLDALASDSLVPPFWPAPDRTVSEDFADAEPAPEDAGGGFVVAVGAQPNATDTITSNPQ
jgi:hypothetical protein